MSWSDYVKATQDLGFTKVTIIAKHNNFQPIGYSRAEDTPQSYEKCEPDEYTPLKILYVIDNISRKYM